MAMGVARTVAIWATTDLGPQVVPMDSEAPPAAVTDLGGLSGGGGLGGGERTHEPSS